MSGKSKIEWTDATWNPVTGCDQVSEGCDNCYALTLAARLKKTGSLRYQVDGSPKTSGPGFGVTLHPDTLEVPLRWTKPRMVFVNSMSDLFHSSIPDSFIAQVFGVMGAAHRHTFQVLTKRPRRMLNLLSNTYWTAQATDYAGEVLEWPLPNVWLGVSVEDQRWADQRIPLLAETPSSVRFLSVEPMLGPVSLLGWMEPVHGIGWRSAFDWVILGGESGAKARPMSPEWVRDIRDECVTAAVPFFFKQWGEWSPERPESYHRVTRTRYSHKMFSWARDGKPYNGNNPGPDHFPSVCVWRVGKKKAGRVLDGRTWDEYPGQMAQRVLAL